MTTTNAWTAYRPIEAFAFFAGLRSRLDAHRQSRRLRSTIHWLRKLDPHILDDIGVDKRALHEPEPKIIDSDGRTILL